MELSGGDKPAAVVRVKNVSEIDGDDVVQLYFTVPHSKLRRPAKKLCAFARVHIGAGETAEVRLAVPRHILEIYDTHSGEMLVEQGVYRFMAGGCSDNLPLAGEAEVSGADIPPRRDSFAAEAFDDYFGIETVWSKRLRRFYVRTNSWNGRAVYDDCPFAEKRQITLSAAAFMGKGTLHLHLADKYAEVQLEPSDGYDDFKEYTVGLPEGLPECGRLTVAMSGDICLLGVELK